jgi:hypothetical protein
MPESIRPWVTAGVAVVGAGVIAVAPFEPASHTDIRIASSAIDLSAAPNPFEYYPQVVKRALANADDRLDEYFADPFPIVQAIAQNQFNGLADIAGAAGSLDPVAVVRAILRAVGQPIVSLAKVLGSGEPFETAASLLVRLVPPIVSGVFGAGSALADVFRALVDLDIVGAVNAVINIPARIVDGLLNGRIDGVTDENLGLLTPVIDAPVADQVTGPAAFLIESLQNIGDTISSSAPATTPAGQVPDLAAPAITLPIAPENSSPRDDPPAEATPPVTGSGHATGTRQAESEPDESEPASPSDPEDSPAGSAAAASGDASEDPSPSTDEDGSGDDSTTADADDSPADDGGTDAAGDDTSDDE